VARTWPRLLYIGGNSAQSVQGRRPFQNLTLESRAAGNPLPRPQAQRSDHLTKHGSASESRARAFRAQPDQHDHGHLQPRPADHAEGRSEQAQ